MVLLLVWWFCFVLSVVMCDMCDIVIILFMLMYVFDIFV